MRRWTSRGEASNQTHASKTDPDAKMARKGKEAKLSYNGNLLVENRRGRHETEVKRWKTDQRSSVKA